MKKQKEHSREGITWSEMGKQNVQAEKVYCGPRKVSVSPYSIQNVILLKRAKEKNNKVTTFIVK